MPPVKRKKEKNAETSRPPYTWDQLQAEIARQDNQELKGQDISDTPPGATYSNQQTKRPTADQVELKAREEFWKKTPKEPTHPIYKKFTVSRPRNANSGNMAAKEIDAHYEKRHERLQEIHRAMSLFLVDYKAHFPWGESVEVSKVDGEVIKNLEKRLKFIAEAKDDYRQREKVFVRTAFRQKSVKYNALLWQRKIAATRQQFAVRIGVAIFKIGTAFLPVFGNVSNV